ncbi:MAG: hypothetical protein HY421_00360 [Candidatus Kerfeldbacteria bacterium]|nr:hypothetical protein [Candidatus Kerfeldbacteria bacterium]
MPRSLIVVALVITALVPTTTAFANGQPFLPNPLKCDDTICLFAQMIRLFLGAVALLATVFFIYGGFVFLTSGGNADRVKKGKETLFWATIGIVVIILSWAIIQFVLNTLVDQAGRKAL